MVTKEEHSRYMREWRKKNPEKAAAIEKRRHIKNHEERKAKMRAYYKNNAKRWLAYKKTSWAKLKSEIYEAYGGAKCACCGETTIQFLSIDHINGGGNKHRKEVGGNTGVCQWIKKNGFPPGFQILCMNCQFGKKYNHGICPHKVPK